MKRERREIAGLNKLSAYSAISPRDLDGLFWFLYVWYEERLLGSFEGSCLFFRLGLSPCLYPFEPLAWTNRCTLLTNSFLTWVICSLRVLKAKRRNLTQKFTPQRLLPTWVVFDTSINIIRQLFIPWIIRATEIILLPFYSSNLRKLAAILNAALNPKKKRKNVLFFFF